MAILLLPLDYCLGKVGVSHSRRGFQRSTLTTPLLVQPVLPFLFVCVRETERQSKCVGCLHELLMLSVS